MCATPRLPGGLREAGGAWLPSPARLLGSLEATAGLGPLLVTVCEQGRETPGSTCLPLWIIFSCRLAGGNSQERGGPLQLRRPSGGQRRAGAGDTPAGGSGSAGNGEGDVPSGARQRLRLAAVGGKARATR